MRNPIRIYPLCNKLAEYWSRYPDLRFGQLMYNFMKWIEIHKSIDPFYIEDDMILEFLEEYFREK